MADTGSLLSIGVRGIQSGLQSAQKSAETISRLGVGSEQKDTLGDFAQAAVDLKSSELQVKASSKVVAAAGDMIGTIIDTLA